MALKYLVREPAVINNHTPLLLLLHGYGSNEADLFGLAGQLPENALIISARAPKVIAENSFAWYSMNFVNNNPVHEPSEAEKSRQVILQFIDQVVAKYHLNPHLVYLMGFSQGAIMSYSIGLTHPEKVKGIIVLSGRILPEIKAKVAGYEKLKSLKIFIGHGTEDNVLPISNGREANTFLTGLKLKPSWHEYPMKHEISPKEFADLKEWLKDALLAN